MRTIGLSIWSLGLMISWLLPNHYLPWASFHSEAWFATSLWLGFGSVFIFASLFQWRLISIIVAICSFIPFIQFSLGIIPFFGQAWITSLYLLGCGLTIVLSEAYERQISDSLPIALFAAIGMAALCSVGLQFYTWFDLHEKGLTDIWSMGLSTNRPYANLGQPNQLALLLIWGLLSGFWSFEKRFINGAIAIGLVALFLLGIALTASRMGFLVLTCLVGVVCFWRQRWRSSSVWTVAIALYLFYLLAPTLLEALFTTWRASVGSMIDGGVEATSLRESPAKETRLLGWTLMLNATTLAPWLGFGWTSVAPAQVGVAPFFPPLGEVFGSSHNLFLDFILWNGWPLGILLIGILIYFSYQLLRNINSGASSVLLLMLMAVGIYSMLEFPLQYSYFLLPASVMLGILYKDLPASNLLRSTRRIIFVLWIALGISLSWTFFEYFRSEDSYYQLRFEKARIGHAANTIGRPPDNYLLTQLHYLISIQRLEIRKQMPEKDLVLLDIVVRYFPSGNSAYLAAKAFALNADRERAQYWIDRICKFDAHECSSLKSRWTQEQQSELAMNGYVWHE